MKRAPSRSEKLVAAEQIVVGDLSALQGGMVLDLRLVDVKTGKSLKAETVQIASLSDMQDRAFEAAYRLAGMKYVSADLAVKETGDIYVKAPTGVTLDVYLDGGLRGKTPLVIEKIEFGVHLLECKATGYAFKKEISVSTKDILEVFADAAAIKGNLLIQILPAIATGHKLMVDGVERPEAGLVRDLPVGEVAIRVTDNGWLYEGTATVSQDKTERFQIVLKAVGALLISGPDGAKIALSDGKTRTEVGNHTDMTVPVGRYTYEVTHPDYETFRGEVEIKQSDSVDLAPELKHNQRFTLEEKIRELTKAREAAKKRSTGMTRGGIWTLSLAALAGIAVGVLEAVIPSVKESVATSYAAYDAATVPETAQTLWSQVDSANKTLGALRIARTRSLIGSGVLGLGSGVLFIAAPSTTSIDRELRKTEEELRALK